MKNNIVLPMLAFLGIFVLCQNIAGQTEKVKFKFEVDGKQVRQKFKVLIDVNGKIVETKSSKNSFIIPAQLRECGECRTVSIRFSSPKYILAFDGVYRKDFGSDWVLGIDNRPFNADNMNTSTSYENVKTIHYLNFRPKDNEIATGLTVLYPNDAKTQPPPR